MGPPARCVTLSRAIEPAQARVRRLTKDGPRTNRGIRIRRAGEQNRPAGARTGHRSNGDHAKRQRQESQQQGPKESWRGPPAASKQNRRHQATITARLSLKGPLPRFFHRRNISIPLGMAKVTENPRVPARNSPSGKAFRQAVQHLALCIEKRQRITAWAFPASFGDEAFRWR